LANIDYQMELRRDKTRALIALFVIFTLFTEIIIGLGFAVYCALYLLNPSGGSVGFLKKRILWYLAQLLHLPDRP
jgi:hypothetical protein